MITHITVEDAAKLISRIAGANEMQALTYIREAADRGEIQTADALEKLQTENEKLQAELEKVKNALAMMWFAYVNSDKETPHSYETETIEEAERLLGPWEECMPKYLWRGIKEG